MRVATISEDKKCPKCGKIENQVKAGKNRSGTQRCKCKECNLLYTIEPKKREYPEETRKLAMKIYYSGVSGRGVGKILGMNKANVYNWIKKTRISRKRHYQILDLDELYWFIGHKGKSKTRENVYLLTMVSRSPRQIVGFDVAARSMSMWTILAFFAKEGGSVATRSEKRQPMAMSRSHSAVAILEAWEPCIPTMPVNSG